MIASAVMALSVLSACSEVVYAPDEDVAAVRYQHDGPPALALITTVNKRTGDGAHSALVVNVPQERVLFDPSGLVDPGLVERHDVLFGITPQAADQYVRVHTGERHYTIVQHLPVRQDQAQSAYDKVLANGPALPATCARTISSILRDIDGFEYLPSTWYPVTLADAFAQLDGVEQIDVQHTNDASESQALIALMSK
jgi:hypothetical protein